jgi:RHS repeat-associated protein
MLVPNRHSSSDGYRYGFSGKEKDDELKGEGNSYDFGARMLDSRVGRWFAPDPKESKYPSFSTYNYVANSPLRSVDPDGEDIFILFYTIGNKRGDEMFEAAALTRKVDIEKGKTFDPSKDKVVMIAVQDLSTIESKVADVVKNFSPKYGQTAEFGLWSHGALEGPVGTESTRSNSLDGKQMTLKGWGKIDFNWKQNGSVSANFFGCRTGMDSYVPDRKGSLLTQKWKTEKSFSNKISNLQNFENILVSGKQIFHFHLNLLIIV